MNTIGKILVVCILLLALSVGAFFGFDFVTRTNWKKGFDDLQRELQVAHASTKTLKETNNKLNDDRKKAIADLDSERTKSIEEQAAFKAELTLVQSKIEDAELKTKAAELSLAQALAQQERLKEEVKGLLVTLAKRESTILTVEEEAKRSKIDAVTYKNDRDTIQARNEALLAQLHRAQQTIAEIQNRGVSGTTLVRDPSAPNPPAAYVKGIIEKVDPVDRALVEISLGTDHGVGKSHTLEVYRTNPRPEYLGTIRIIDSFAHKSVGKLVRPNLQRTPLQSGDIVASSLANP